MQWSRWTLSVILLPIMFGLSTSDINQDKTECGDQLVGLAPCLPYVGGEAGTPTIDCCSGLKQVLDKSRKCLCVLIKDRDDPQLGLNINVSLALTLPSACRAPVNMSNCISLLHLKPNSQEAKLFEGYQKLTDGHSSAPAAATARNSSTNSAADKSDGEKAKRWIGVDMAFGVSLWIFTIYHNHLGV
ncbi:non-specific lipid transfer protein GPI-anchored 6-like isoform X2 [Hibiscus syriacus]|uniref:non-specific lipid transfer protein GPI-anchored 6-like isoform X2 n=1 Tax=Hibiscus syriacus TaxID=106335 RepID=UPI001921074F|nr:non-specific lipid transfer protein GPI-anchored 6-like isoform X2 [Hibiscus syriacus]